MPFGVAVLAVLALVGAWALAAQEPAPSEHQPPPELGLIIVPLEEVGNSGVSGIAFFRASTQLEDVAPPQANGTPDAGGTGDQASTEVVVGTLPLGGGILGIGETEPTDVGPVVIIAGACEAPNLVALTVGNLRPLGDQALPLGTPEAGGIPEQGPEDRGWAFVGSMDSELAPFRGGGHALAILRAPDDATATPPAGDATDAQQNIELLACGEIPLLRQ